MKKVVFFISLSLVMSVYMSCKTTQVSYGPGTPSIYHSSYNDTSVMIKAGPMLMPYNRFIDPIGSVIRFGSHDKENHSLDCIVLPDAKTLAVENRYGVTMIDIPTKKVLYEFQYKN